MPRRRRRRRSGRARLPGHPVTLAGSRDSRCRRRRRSTGTATDTTIEREFCCLIFNRNSLNPNRRPKVAIST